VEILKLSTALRNGIARGREKCGAAGSLRTNSALTLAFRIGSLHAFSWIDRLSSISANFFDPLAVRNADALILGKWRWGHRVVQSDEV